MGNKLNQIFCKTYTYDLDEPINTIDSYTVDQLESINTILVSKKDLNYLNFVYIDDDDDISSFNRNNLNEITQDFSQINLSNLNIKSISSKIFHSLTSIIEIDLSNNCLQILNSNLFNGLINLKILKLNLNKLEKQLDIGLFAGCICLEWIDLSDNLLEKLDNRIFTGLNSLKHVGLNNNKWCTNKQIFYFYSPIDLQTNLLDLTQYQFLFKLVKMNNNNNYKNSSQDCYWVI